MDRSTDGGASGRPESSAGAQSARTGTSSGEHSGRLSQSDWAGVPPHLRLPGTMQRHASMTQDSRISRQSSSLGDRRQRGSRSVEPHEPDTRDEHDYIDRFDRNDDEYRSLDRGVELVRKRMRERKRDRLLKKRREVDQELAQSFRAAAQESEPIPEDDAEDVAGKSVQRGFKPPQQEGEQDSLHGAGMSPQSTSMSASYLSTPNTSRHPSMARGRPDRRQSPSQPRWSAAYSSSARSTRTDNDDADGSVFRASDDDGDEEEGEDEEDEGNQSSDPYEGQDEDAILEEDEESPETDDNKNIEYTLKDRQDAFNIEHPFGLPIWKPALYKKTRSVTRHAEAALHRRPGLAAGRMLLPGNVLWTLLFGIWLGAACLLASLVLRFLPRGGRLYARVMFEMAQYIVWPFGKYVEVECSHESGARHASVEEDTEGSGNASADDSSRTAQPAREPTETSALNADHSGTNYGTHGAPTSEEQRLRMESGVYHYVYDDQGRDVGMASRVCGMVVYTVLYTLVILPTVGSVCLLCWALVVPIPMAKLTWVLLKNLASQPLALHFRSTSQIDPSKAQAEHMYHPEEEDGDVANMPGYVPYGFHLKPGQMAPGLKKHHLKKRHDERRSMILLCTYRAMGKEYFKYTIGGVNIIFVNTIPMVFFTILLFFCVRPLLAYFKVHSKVLTFLTSDGTIFVLSLASVLPLSYFIGMAVASISTQSSIGMGAVINATFGSIIELILYSLSLTGGRAGLVEGSLIGSILAGVLLMPGVSMCSGATRRKEQKFNARSAGVTSTMLIMAIIGTLTPTIFYQIYGTFQLECDACPPQVSAPGDSWMCKRCTYEHMPPMKDPFFQTNVKGLIYACTGILVLSYCIGLWFSLRTHASQIWQNAQSSAQQLMNATSSIPESLPPMHRASVYKRILPANVLQQLLPTHNEHGEHGAQMTHSPALTADSGAERQQAPESSQRAKHRANDDPAATPRVEQQDDSQQRPRRDSKGPLEMDQVLDSVARAYQYIFSQTKEHAMQQQQQQGEPEEPHAGHDAPSWSRFTSTSVLLGCTILYAIIAEILVDVLDVVLNGSGLSEKFIGVTLFALVPNTTEFMNAMSFAISGNIALSMEIGSAYVLQVCLIQMPYMVVFSALWNAFASPERGATHEGHVFTLIFPRWDVIAIIFSIFLLTYTYIEARSNYHRGSILVLSYLVLMTGFFFAPDRDPEDPNDPIAAGRRVWPLPGST